MCFGRGERERESDREEEYECRRLHNLTVDYITLYRRCTR